MDVLDKYLKVSAIQRGEYLLHTTLVEMRMSHWVEQFFISERCSSSIVLDFRLLKGDLVRYEEVKDELLLCFRIYPDGNTDLRLKINFNQSVFEFKGEEYTFDQLYEVIHKEII